MPRLGWIPYRVSGYNGRVFNRLKNWLTTGWRRRWRQAHLAFSPIGVLIATGLLSRTVGVWGWGERDSLGFFADLIPLGIIVYATAIFALERMVIMVFWALAQREKFIEERRAEGLARGIAQGRAQGVAEGRAEGVVEGRAEGVVQGRAEGVVEGRAEGISQGISQGQRQEQERILRLLEQHGIQAPPGIFAGALAARGAVLLESGDVYGGPSLDVYLGRISPEGRTLAAQRGGPPELPDVWCRQGWRVQLDRHFEELLLAGRIQGLSLDTSAAVWTVSSLD